MTHLLFFEHISGALRSLRATRMRTLLTVAGVAIGIASITAILSLSHGITNIVRQQVTDLGGNLAIVRPGDGAPQKAASLTDSLNRSAYTTSSLTEQDIAAIDRLSHVSVVAPLMVIDGTLHAKSSSAAATVLATTPNFIKTTNLPIRDGGQFLDETTNTDTAVVGSQLSVDLFGTDQSIGQTFTMRGRTFTVIGVLKSTEKPLNYNMIDFDSAAIINIESGKAFHQGTMQLRQINIQATNATKLDAVAKNVTATLKDSHQGDTDFTVITGATIAQPTSQTFTSIAEAMTLIAAISLIVGGIGIMNIMLVGVAERTREIGLRKSVGASNGDILAQFMTEAFIMSLVGGILGYVGGYLIALAASTFIPIMPAFTWEIAGIAIGTSLIVGGVFGLYPALKAARKDPIESLRQYH